MLKVSICLHGSNGTELSEFWLKIEKAYRYLGTYWSTVHFIQCSEIRLMIYKCYKHWDKQVAINIQYLKGEKIIVII